MQRYFLAQDNDSHWWIVPVARHAEFEKWAEHINNYTTALAPPDWAIEVGGCPSLVTFTNPKIIDR